VGTAFMSGCRGLSSTTFANYVRRINDAIGRKATAEAVNKTRECLIRSSVTRVITGLLNLSRLKKQVGSSMGIESSARVIDYPVDLSLEEQI
jgi:hypothetical protein